MILTSVAHLAYSLEEHMLPSFTIERDQSRRRSRKGGSRLLMADFCTNLTTFSNKRTLIMLGA